MNQPWNKKAEKQLDKALAHIEAAARIVRDRDRGIDIAEAAEREFESASDALDQAEYEQSWDD